MVHLATTRLQEFWPSERPLTLLGLWCVPEHELWDAATRLQYSILPYPWDDRERFDRAAIYVSTVYERILRELADRLNALHGMQQTVRYWRIVIGPWLSWYLEVLYDRITCLREVVDGRSDVKTIGLDPSSYATPADTAEFQRLAATDVYNLQLYTRILESWGVEMPRRSLPDGWHETGGPLPDGFGRWYGQLVGPTKAIVRRAQERVVRSSRVGIVGTAIPLKDRFRLWVATGGKIATCFRFCDSESRAARVSEGMRAAIVEWLAPRDEFETVVKRCLPADMPMSCLETFAERRHRALSKRPPRVLVSAFGWYIDEGFKLFAAEAQASGCCLVAAQHGGYYGMLRAISPESHEQALSDRFYGWGWCNGLQPGTVVHALPGFPLADAARWVERRARDHSRARVVFITTMHPRYLYRFQSHPVGPQWMEYVSWQMRFASSVPPDVRRRLLVRFYPHNYGWNVHDCWRSRFPDVAVDDPPAPMGDHLVSAALLLLDHPSTTLLEAMAAEVPLVLFWNPERFAMRPSAVGPFDELRRARILHDTPEAAAAHVNEIVDDIESWWADPGVRDARGQFRHMFARSSPHWLNEWKNELLRHVIAPSGAQVRAS